MMKKDNLRHTTRSPRMSPRFLGALRVSATLRLMKKFFFGVFVLALSVGSLRAGEPLDLVLDIISTADIQAEYEDGNKYVFGLYAKVPFVELAGVTVWIDMADYFGITGEGSEPDPWVTLWIHADAGISATIGVPVGFHLAFMEEICSDPSIGDPALISGLGTVYGEIRLIQKLADISYNWDNGFGGYLLGYSRGVNVKPTASVSLKYKAELMRLDVRKSDLDALISSAISTAISGGAVFSLLGFAENFEYDGLFNDARFGVAAGSDLGEVAVDSGIAGFNPLNGHASTIEHHWFEVIVHNPSLIPVNYRLSATASSGFGILPASSDVLSVEEFTVSSVSIEKRDWHAWTPAGGIQKGNITFLLEMHDIINGWVPVSEEIYPVTKFPDPDAIDTTVSVSVEKVENDRFRIPVSIGGDGALSYGVHLSLTDGAFGSIECPSPLEYNFYDQDGNYLPTSSGASICEISSPELLGLYPVGTTSEIYVNVNWNAGPGEKKIYYRAWAVDGDTHSRDALEANDMLRIGRDPYHSSNAPDYSKHYYDPSFSFTDYLKHEYVVSLIDIMVSGSVKEANDDPIPGCQMTFSNGGGSTTTDSSGDYSHGVPYGWSGELTPSKDGWQFDPDAHLFLSPLMTDQHNQDFTGEALPVAHIQCPSSAKLLPEGETHMVGIRLSQNPSGTVWVSVQRISGDADISVSSGSSLVFDSGNWNSYQSFGLSAAEDADKLNGVATIRCSAPGWASHDLVVTEQDNDAGTIQAFIEPAAARAAGAQWRVEDGPWHNSGETCYDVPWTYTFTVDFKDISGWLTPAPQQMLVNSTHPHAEATGTYVQSATGMGHVSVTLYPSNAVVAGARWRADGGAWQESEATVHNLSAGNHTIDFLEVSGFVKPAQQTINVNDGNTSLTLGWYSPTSAVTYVSSGGNIQAAIDAAAPGDHVILNAGTYNLASHVSVGKAVVLRSLNGPGTTSLSIGGQRDQCLVVGHSEAVVSGLSLTGSDYSVSGGNGGGAHCSAGTVVNCISHDNTAYYGAGFWCGSGATLYNCWADNNESYHEGGGFYLSSGALVESSVTKNNYIRMDMGSGFYCYQGTLRNCLSTGNGTGAYADGGGGCAYGGSVLDCVIVGNTAQDAGGGLNIEPGATIANTQIRNNTAAVGGGFFANGWSPAIIVSNCVIRNNDATSDGGGIWTERALSLVDCTIADNESDEHGGGIYTYHGFAATRTVISNNTSALQGGGIYTEDRVHLINCILSDNTAGGDGGGICLWDSGDSYLINSTICHNHSSGKGGGLYYDDTGADIRNTIIMFNTDSAAGSYENYFEWDPGMLDFDHSCAIPRPTTGSGNIDQSPAFVGSRNYRLQSGSPCIDTGSASSAPDDDIAAVPRPLDGNGSGTAEHDMGAYEYAPPHGSVSIRIDPLLARDRNPQWSLDGGDWYNSDATATYVLQGSHTIVFSDVSGWQKPADIVFTMTADSLFSTNGVYLALSNDTDGDEIPDDYELAIMGRLFYFSFDGDYDSDKLPDYYEWLSGTDPTNPLSCLIFNEGAIGPAPGGGITLQWYSGSGMSFKILRSTNLVEGFGEIDTGVTATPPMNFYTDPESTGTGGWFYMINRDD